MISRSYIALALTLALTGCICGPGEATCDNACVDVSHDIENCGACGERCALGQRCEDGDCVGTPGLPCEDDGSCRDGKFCNGAEHCIEGVCRAGQPVLCDDGIACTDETCSEFLSACVATPTHSRCAPGTRCTGGDADSDGCR